MSSVEKGSGSGLDQQASSFQLAGQKAISFNDQSTALLCKEDEEDENRSDKKMCSYPWTMIYQPESVEEVLGNKTCVLELKSWLSRWLSSSIKPLKKEQPPSSKSRKRKRNGYSAGDSDYDSDSSSESSSSLCNTVLLVGPSGCGKTSAIYAIAKELGYKILEVNANSKRSGRIVLDKLREATQSHQVNDRKLPELSPSKSKLLKTSKNKKSLKVFENVLSETELCEIERDGNNASLILFDDVDIVFSEDDGFWSAVNSFMCSAKRPIILTSSDMKFAEKGRIKESFVEIAFHPPELSMQALHMHLLCLAQGLCIQYESLLRLSEVLGGNFRACLLALEFWSSSELTPLKDTAANFLDENLLIGPSLWELIKWFATEKNAQQKMECLSHLRTFNADILYCHMPSVINGFVSVCHQRDTGDDIKRHAKSPNMIGPDSSDCYGSDVVNRKLGTISRMLDNFSCLDLTAGTVHQRVIEDVDILLGLEDGDTWDEHCDFQLNPLAKDIEEHLHYAMFSSLVAELSNTDAAKHDTLHKMPSGRQCIAKNSSVLSALPLASQLNKRAFYLDYLPCIRNICRSEHVKRTSGNNKRGGRFSHYLCSNVLYLQPCTVNKLGDEFKMPS